MARPYGPAPMINRLVVFSICIPPRRKGTFETCLHILQEDHSYFVWSSWRIPVRPARVVFRFNDNAVGGDCSIHFHSPAYTVVRDDSDRCARLWRDALTRSITSPCQTPTLALSCRAKV